MGYYTEEAKQLNSLDTLDVPSFFIECAQTERQLFEGLIELDFAEVYNEAGIISLTEADEEKATEEADKATNNFIVKIWKGFIEAIKNALQKVKEKFDEFLRKLADKKVDKDKLIAQKDIAAKCDKKDIWYKDYMDACDAIISKSAIEEIINNYTVEASVDGYFKKYSAVCEKIMDAAKDAGFMYESDFDMNDSFERTFWEMTKAVDAILVKIPTDAEDTNFNGIFGVNLDAVELGSKANELPDLVRELSLQGLSKRIDKCFKMLAKDDTSKFKIQKGDSKEIKNAKKNCPQFP